MLRRLLLEQRGVVAFLGALLTPVLVGIAALTVDLGQMWQISRQLQNCADAAALAGAWQLNNQAQVIATATSYLNNQAPGVCASNGAAAPAFIFLDRNGDGASDAVRVTVSRGASLGFAHLLGVNSASVTRKAAAGKFTPSSFEGLEPFSLQVDPNQPCGRAGIHQYTVNGQYLQYWQEFILKVSASTLNLPGNFQALDFGGAGANGYRDNIIYGYNGWVSSCDAAVTKTGNMVQPTVNGLDQRIQNGAANWPQCTALLAGNPSRWSDCPRVVTIALIPPLANGKTDTQVLTFAWFYVTSYVAQGNQNAEVHGMFLDVGDKFAPPEQWRGNNVWTPSSSLPFGVKLIE